MDSYLLKLGISDQMIRLRGQREVLGKEAVEELLEIIRQVEQFIHSLEKKGIPFRIFLDSKNEAGFFPRFQVKIGEENRFFYTEEEIQNIQKEEETKYKEQREKVLETLSSEEGTADFQRSALPVIELFELSHLSMLQEKLAHFDFSLSEYILSEGKLLDILVDESEIPVFSLKEAIDLFRNNGRKGLEIQRYKGLGEMNADQLWETTMDPAKRTLLQVTIPDAVAADHAFTMLMGEEVAPRKQFIEQHALFVKNLDI
jgi:DNA gyrase subunit B